MAIYSLQMKTVSRSSGRSAVAAAAYRAGAIMRDERTGLAWDYSRKTGVLHSEIIAPANAPAWAYDRAALWNAAEAREDKSTRRDTAVTGRDFIIALPHELTHAERVAAVRAFAADLVARYGVAVDFAVHAPDPHGDDRNYHAHVLITSRALGPDGFGSKTRALDTLRTGRAELLAIRQSWESIANRFLEAGGHEARIDHRSLEAQGIDREATIHLGPNASGMERKGQQTDLGERNRKAVNDNGDRAKLAAEHEAITAEIFDLDRERERRRGEMRTAAREVTAESILSALTARQATFTERDLARELSKAISDPFQRRDLAAAILSRRDVVGLAEDAGAAASRFTTEAVLTEEVAALAAAGALAAERSHAVGRRALMDTLTDFAGMNAEQRAATFRATGPEGFSMVSGEAGTGKSFTLGAVRQAYEAEGCRVIGLSYTNAVVQDMARDGFKETRTIAGALLDAEKGAAGWNSRTVLVVDEAGMLATKDMVGLLTTAQRAGAKVILAGDEAQLSSIMRGGMFAALREQHGAAVLSEVVRVKDADQARAFNQMHEGQFRAALATFEEQGRISWGDTQDEARAALVAKWAADTAARPEATRFVFAYTNAEVHALNADLRAIRKDRGELGEETRLATKDGPADFAPGDRVQFTGSAWNRAARDAGLANGNVGTIRAIEGERVTVALDGKPGSERVVSFTVGEDQRAGQFNALRHGYAGTIYKGQGRTVDDAYALHSQHWRSASSYVATTRHRDNVTIFTARELAADLDTLAGQMGRTEEKRAASMFQRAERATDPGAGYGKAAQEATGRPQTGKQPGPVSNGPKAENGRPTPAEMAEAPPKSLAEELLRERREAEAERKRSGPARSRDRGRTR
jgi:Ti-type conjugative transfer relaxase TraA